MQISTKGEATAAAAKSGNYPLTTSIEEPTIGFVMEEKPSAKQMIRNLLGNYEFLWLQNEAMKIMFASLERSHGITGWQQRLRQLAADKELQSRVREMFQPLYAAADAAMDEAAVLELLRKIPTAGTIN